MKQWEMREKKIEEMEKSLVTIEINKHELKWILILIEDKNIKLEAIIQRAEKRGEDLCEFEDEIQILLMELEKKLSKRIK